MSIRLIHSSLLYDVLLAVPYAWSVFQAYVYDAKTQTTGILSYVLVYGGFTLLIRSPRGVILMNLLSIATLPWIFSVPVIREAGSYFGFQPDLGFFATVLIGIVQGCLSIPLLSYGQKFLSARWQFAISACAAVVFTIGITILATTAHARLAGL